jgi:hypothetical protein
MLIGKTYRKHRQLFRAFAPTPPLTAQRIWEPSGHKRPYHPQDHRTAHRGTCAGIDRGEMCMHLPIDVPHYPSADYLQSCTSCEWSY